MIEFIQVTAQYSNAVLVAILPQISEFVRKVELPMPTPIALQQVAEFKCFPTKDDVGGSVILTNGLWVSYHFGYVNGFRTPRSYYNLQDPQQITRFYGALRMDKDEALQFARRRVLNLGYTMRGTFTDQEPAVDLPPRIGTNVVPHYRFKWKDPVFGREVVTIEVDADRKAVQEMRLSSHFFWRPPPRIAVEAKLRNPKPPISLAMSNQFLAITLPKVSELARRLKLPLRQPMNENDVERVVFVDPDSDVRIRLTNGYWFESQYGVVAEFNAPDTVYGRQTPGVDRSVPPFESYLGQWKLSENAAIEVVHHAITNLGYTLEQFHAQRSPKVLKPDSVGDYVVPRYCFQWITNNPATGGTIAMVVAEVDGDQGQIKWLQLLGEPLSYATASTTNRQEKRVFETNGAQKRSISLDTKAPRQLRGEDASLNDMIEYLNKVMLDKEAIKKLPPPATNRQNRIQYE